MAKELNLAQYLDDEPAEAQGARYVARKQTRKSKPNYDGWNGGYKKPKPPRARRDNGETGTGKKSSGKRNRCGVEGCQAFASPALSGYCSYHESKHLNEGEKPAALKGRLCLECHNLCEPPRPGEDEPQYCNQCLEWQNEPNPDNEYDLDEL